MPTSDESLLQIEVVAAIAQRANYAARSNRPDLYPLNVGAYGLTPSPATTSLRLGEGLAKPSYGAYLIAFVFIISIVSGKRGVGDE